MTYVHYVWSLLSVLVAVTCTFSFLQPDWFVHPNLVNSFGIYSFCVNHFPLDGTRQQCAYYGGRFGFGNIPATAWQAACLLYAGGCMFTCCGALCSLATTCMRNGHDKTLVLVTRYLQIAAFFLLSSGLLVYPAGLGSHYFRYYCGHDAASFRSGHCHIGWAFLLALAGTAVSVFCPILSYFSSHDSETDSQIGEKV